MSKKEKDISLTVNEEAGDVTMVTPYNKQFLNDFKNIVPPDARADEDGRGWNGIEMHWIFTFEYRDQVQMLIEQHFGKPDHRIARLEQMRKRR